MNEARIRVLEHHLAEAVVGEAESGDSVGVGSRVRFRESDGDGVTEVTLVHPLEASVAEGKISIESPVAQWLDGRSVGRCRDH